MATVLITGISGLIGKNLARHLLSRNYTVHGLGRSNPQIKGVSFYSWDVETGQIDHKAFDNVSYIVHLAGAGIADKRWTKTRQDEIIRSRTQSTKLLFNTISALRTPVKGFFGASAIGAYGLKTNETIYTETDRETDDFFGVTCKNWEDSYQPFIQAGIRTVIGRIGIVLSANGGAYAKMKVPHQFGLGSAFGSGKHYMPFIHLNDLVNAIEWLMTKEQLNGTYNLVAGEHVTNYQFNKALAKSLNKPFFMPGVPAWVLRLLLGEMHLMLTEGSRVSNARLSATGFTFNFPTLEAALNDLARH
ncbi:MAG: TIGR01777 family oxidoreductase [Sediminibacterium sp.]|nr:TIGR01777 family oxidoreductase [Sediminibacterium sp.]